MTPLLFYLLKQAAIAGLCLAYYGLTLRNKARHQRSRWFLAGSVLASLLLPLVPVYWPAAPQNVITMPVQAVQLQVVQVATQEAAPHVPLPRFETVYAVIALLLLLRMAYSYWRLRRLQLQSVRHPHADNVILARHSSVGLPFSFFNVIFWNATMPIHNGTGAQILQHEMVHVRQHHSLDKLLLELVCACCWVNPFFYLYRREMALVHEFLADEGAAGDKAQYAETLLHTAFQPSWALTSNFFHPPIQRRIQMLFLKPTKTPFMKKLALLPLGMALAAVMNCQAQDASGQANALPVADLSKVVVVAYNDANDHTPDNNKTSRQYAAAQHSAYDEQSASAQNMPSYPGGKDALLQFFARNIRYPAAARNEHRTGTVYVQFVVTAEGHVKNARVVGESHPDLEKEVLRLVHDMPDWNPGTGPGKKAAVQLSLPVQFSLQS